MNQRTFVVVGAGLAGGAAVQTLRQEGYEGRLVLVGQEPHLPYERPPLSKEYLRGEQDLASLFLRDDGWYRDADVQAHLGTSASKLEPEDRTVILEGGEAIRYDALLLATGGRPRHLDRTAGRTMYLRTIEDADRIRSHLDEGRHLVVVGAGFIGAEVAASARTLGKDVTVLEAAPVPLHRALGEEMGRVYADIHRDHGVDLRTGQGVSSIEETGGGVVVRTTGGDAIEGDAVVVGVGIEPRTELAAAAGLAVDNGVVVDAACRTSAEGVFAAGDVANHDHPVFGRRLRVEHFDNALRMGAAAAKSMLGVDEPYDHPHWFWSDQYDLNLQYGGFAFEWDRIVIRGSVEDRDFVAFYLKDGVLLAALGLNRGKEVRRAMKLISARAAPDPETLADEDVDLRKLAPKS
jgi:3-phenylpropionate/trans-cinnamate dioxygenase ferredoxin reductase subunit